MREFYMADNVSPETAGERDYAAMMGEYEDFLNRRAGREFPSSHDDIIEQLNGACPFKGKAVLFKGTGIFPRQRSDGRMVDGCETRIGITGIHQGIRAVILRQREQEWRKVYHYILLSNKKDTAAATSSVEEKLFCYIDADSEIIPYASLEDIYAHGSDGETTLSANSWAELQNITSDIDAVTSSEQYRQLPRLFQQQRLEPLIGELEDQVPIRDKRIAFCGTRCYSPSIKNGRLAQNQLDINEIPELNGVCLGYEYLASNRTADTATDEPEYEPGLCIAVDPSRHTRDRLALLDRQLLFVPISNKDNSIVII